MLRWLDSSHDEPAYRPGLVWLLSTRASPVPTSPLSCCDLPPARCGHDVLGLRRSRIRPERLLREADLPTGQQT